MAAVTTIYTVDDLGRITGSVPVVELLRAAPGGNVDELADRDAVVVSPDTDLSDVALLMADYNLVSVPVVDEEDHIIGLVTVDDVLEVIIPEDWRRRQPPPRPERPRSAHAGQSS